METQVYSWRVSRELKTDLEQQARLRKTSVSAVLNLAVRDWLKQSTVTVGEDEEPAAGGDGAPDDPRTAQAPPCPVTH